MASAGSLHERAVYVAVFLEEIVTRHRHASHRMQSAGLVGPAHRTLPQIIKEFVDYEFNFADNDRIAMLERLLGHEAGMHPAHHDGYASGAELVGNLISAVDVTGHRGDSDEIGLQVEINGFNVLIGEDHFVLIARNRCGDCHNPASGE